MPNLLLQLKHHQSLRTTGDKRMGYAPDQRNRDLITTGHVVGVGQDSIGFHAEHAESVVIVPRSTRDCAFPTVATAGDPGRPSVSRRRPL